MVIIAIMYNESGGALIRTQSAEQGGREVFMIGSHCACFPNPIFICCKCNKNLGDRYSRLKGNKVPNVTVIDGNQYCDKCADKYYESIMKSIKKGD